MGSQPSAPTLDVAGARRLTRADYQLKEEFTPKLSLAAGKAARSEYERNLEFALGQLGDRSIGQRYEQFLPEEARRRRGLLDQLDAAQTASTEYSRLQTALSDTSGGTLGQALTAEAERRAQSIGQLTPQEQREAAQQSRAAMAARGMATGTGAMGAELLNRDRFVQQRRADDLNLIGGVGQANEMRRVGYAEQSAGLAEQERMRQLGVRQDGYNFALGSNPNMMAIGLGGGYANMTQPAISMMGGQNVTPIYTGGSAGTAGQNMQLMGTLGGGALAAGGMVAGAAII